MEGISTPCIWAKPPGLGLRNVLTKVYIGVSCSFAGYIAPGGNSKFMHHEEPAKNIGLEVIKIHSPPCEGVGP